MRKESENNAFDKFFKKRYSKHELKAPPELWKKIHSRANYNESFEFDKTLRDRYTNKENKPPDFLWKKISLYNTPHTTNFFLKYLPQIKWIGIIFLFGIIGISLFHMIFNDINSRIPQKGNPNTIEIKEKMMMFPSDSLLYKKTETCDSDKEITNKKQGNISNVSEIVETLLSDNKIISIDTVPSKRSSNKEIKNKNKPIVVHNKDKETNEVSNSSDEVIIKRTFENQEITQRDPELTNRNETIETYEVSESNDKIVTKKLHTNKIDNANNINSTSENPDSNNTYVDKYQSVSDYDNPENALMTTEISKKINKENKIKNELLASNNKGIKLNKVSNNIEESKMNRTLENQEITTMDQELITRNETIKAYEVSVLNDKIDSLQTDTTKINKADNIKSISKNPDSKITDLEESETEPDSSIGTIISEIHSDTLGYKPSESGFILSTHITPTYSFFTLNISDQIEVNEFYNNNHNDSWYFSTSVRTAYQFNKKWSLNFGLGYSRFIQKLEFRNANPNEFPNISLDGINKFITVFSSLNTVISDSLEYFEFTYPGGDPLDPNDYQAINYQEEQKFRFITIPITSRFLIGNKKIKGIFDAGLQTTINFSAASFIQISTVIQSGETVNFRNYHDVNTFGLQLTTGIGLQYELKNRISLILVSNFNYSIFNLNNNNYSIIKPCDIGVSSGIQYHF